MVYGATLLHKQPLNEEDTLIRAFQGCFNLGPNKVS